MLFTSHGAMSIEADAACLRDLDVLGSAALPHVAQPDQRGDEREESADARHHLAAGP